MRKIFFCFILYLVVMVVATMTSSTDKRSDQEKFRQALIGMQHLSYTDPDFGYHVHYPSFFEKEDMKDYGVGHVQFGYHAHNINLVMECKVVPESVITSRKHNFIKQGMLADMEGYDYYSHYVYKHHLFYILTLYYPSDYRKAFERIIYDVKIWNPFYRNKHVNLHR